jgi:hypothetical protein
MARSTLVLSVLLLSLHARTCGGGDSEAPPPAHTPAVQVDLSSPYEVADQALDAYREKDLATYSALLVEPPSPDEKVFTREIEEDDAIRGLYFLDEGKTIAAIIRHADGEVLAMWFRIVRTDDGFRVDKLMVTDETPPTDTPVEG